MTQNITAEIISIGTEILLGELTDTNSVFIGRTLRDLGINVYFMTSVGDNEGRIVSAIQIALSRADMVITCGGLGPTVDDMTRQSIASATERGLTFHQYLLDQIAERFKGFNVSMTENNKRQAYLPDDAIVVENPVGTAPSFIIEEKNKIVISLPGVPREMKFLLQENIVPYLRNKYELGLIKARTLKTAGIGESTLDSILGLDLLESSNPSIGLAAHSGQIDVRVTAKASTESEADKLIAHMEAQIRERVGQFIFGADEDQLQDILAELILSNDLKIAIVEAGTNAQTGNLIRDTNIQLPESHIEQIQVSHPEELRVMFNRPANETWRDMADNIGKSLISQKNISICIVILSDPDAYDATDSEEKTVISVRTVDKERTRVYGFGSKADLTRNWISIWSLSSAWRMLQDSSNT